MFPFWLDLSLLDLVEVVTAAVAALTWFLGCGGFRPHGA